MNENKANNLSQLSYCRGILKMGGFLRLIKKPIGKQTLAL